MSTAGECLHCQSGTLKSRKRRTSQLANRSGALSLYLSISLSLSLSLFPPPPPPPPECHPYSRLFFTVRRRQAARGLNLSLRAAVSRTMVPCWSLVTQRGPLLRGAWQMGRYDCLVVYIIQ
jgi:hypothetical protein